MYQRERRYYSEPGCEPRLGKKLYCSVIGYLLEIVTEPNDKRIIIGFFVLTGEFFIVSK